MSGLAAKTQGDQTVFESRVLGCLLGGAAGDALGLPFEGLSARRAARMFRRNDEPLTHHLFFGRGMFSDDTEHACMTAQALLASRGEPAAFARSLAWRLRAWLASLPAGVGMATAKGICKLWLGFPPARSGVNSAGNGPAMRAAIIGLFARDIPHLRELVRSSTTITHAHPSAEQGALAVALAARFGAQAGADGVSFDAFRAAIEGLVTEDAILRALEVARPLLQSGDDARDFARSMGWNDRVSGYINHSVPAALYCWLRWPGHFEQAVLSAIEFGGDTDTVGAITGGIAGATAGIDAIPAIWLDRIIDWPRSVNWMKRLGVRLAAVLGGDPSQSRPLPLFWPAIIPRNVLFLGTVLVHGLRRVLPPY